MRTQVILKAIALLALPTVMFLASCDPNAIKGNGDVLTETRNVQDFNGIDVSVSGDVHVTQGQTFKVIVRAEENLLPYLETEVQNGSLHIYFSHNVRDVDDLEVEITMPELKKVQVSSSSHLHTHGTFNGNTLNLGMSGSGEIKLSDIDFQYINADVSGSGNIQLIGIGKELDANVSGSGTIDALQCPVETAEAHVSGSGTIKLKVSDALVAYVSGSGHVRYEGSPDVEKHISGSGSVTKL